MKLLAALALVVACGVHAQPLALPPPPQATLDQRPGARIPLDTAAVDESGTAVRLADYFDGHRPVLLVPGYYRCPQLCGLVMHGLIDSLKQSGVPPSQWRIVGFSIDPQDTVRDARSRRGMDVVDADSPVDLHLLVLAEGDGKRLAAEIGYGFQATQESGPQANRFAHPAAVVLLTPHGAVSRYFNGVAFDPNELRVALADAAGDRIGGVTARLALLCAHFDPHTGKYTDAVMTAIRMGSLLLLAGIAAWVWRRRNARGTRT
jgi:protein SCO1/2